ncbi:hypothetical protein [Mariniphaga sp.]
MCKTTQRLAQGQTRVFYRQHKILGCINISGKH